MLSPSIEALFDVMTELWNTGNAALLSQVYSEDAVRVDPFSPEPLARHPTDWGFAGCHPSRLSGFETPH